MDCCCTGGKMVMLRDQLHTETSQTQCLKIAQKTKKKVSKSLKNCHNTNDRMLKFSLKIRVRLKFVGFSLRTNFSTRQKNQVVSLIEYLQDIKFT